MMNDEKCEPHPSEFLEFATSPFAPPPPSSLNPPGESSPAGQNDHSPGAETPKDAVLILSSPSDQEVVRRMSAAVPNLSNLIESSRAAASAEHRMTFLQGLRLYPKAMGWSALLSLTIVMEAYDLSIINSFFAFPEFKQSYGIKQPNGTFQVGTAWQSALTNGGVAGEIIGLFFNGVFTDRFGYRYTLIGALISLCFFIFLAFFAVKIEMLMASEVLCGLSWGIFQTLSTTYAAEVMPVALRAYLTSNVNLCWLIGQLIGNSVLRGCLRFKSQWSYRVPFGLQWVWAIPILIGVFFAPESPWWFVRRGRTDDAKRALLRLTRRDGAINVDETVAMMDYTNEVEKQLSSGDSYLDCFRGSDRRRTEISCMVWVTQSLCGSAMTGYATYFYIQAGFPTARAFDLTMAMYGMAIIGEFVSWFSMRHFGRRTLYLWGCGLCTTVMLTSGCIGTQEHSSTMKWVLGSMIIIFTFVYDSTIGPVCYSLVAEIPSTRLRVKTVVLARISYNLAILISNLLMPKMLNPTAWNWKGKTCFFWAGTCSVCWLWCYFRLPEPKGLTYLELDILFEKRAGARKFAKFHDILASTGYFSLESGGNEESWHGNVNPVSPTQQVRPMTGVDTGDWATKATGIAEAPSLEKVSAYFEDV